MVRLIDQSVQTYTKQDKFKQKYCICIYTSRNASRICRIHYGEEWGEREREREREREGKRTERDGKDHAEFARLILRNCAQIP